MKIRFTVDSYRNISQAILRNINQLLEALEGTWQLGASDRRFKFPEIS